MKPWSRCASPWPPGWRRRWYGGPCRGVIVTGRSVDHVRSDDTRVLLKSQDVVWNDLVTDAARRVYAGQSWPDPARPSAMRRAAPNSAGARCAKASATCGATPGRHGHQRAPAPSHGSSPTPNRRRRRSRRLVLAQNEPWAQSRPLQPTQPHRPGPVQSGHGRPAHPQRVLQRRDVVCLVRGRLLTSALNVVRVLVRSPHQTWGVAGRRPPLLTCCCRSPEVADIRLFSLHSAEVVRSSPTSAHGVCGDHVTASTRCQRTVSWLPGRSRPIPPRTYPPRPLGAQVGARDRRRTCPGVEGSDPNCLYLGASCDRRVRLKPNAPPSQGGDTGSNPVGAARGKARPEPIS
jgi:hypothetical protein